MTNQDYLEKRTAGLGASKGDIELILLKGDLAETGSLDYKKCEEALYNFSIIQKGTVEKAGEGGYSMERRMEVVKEFYRILCIELGKENRLWPSVIEDMSDIW